MPAHPLPLYFAASALALLAVLLWLYWRNAPPGALLATFCILEPTAKLALEPLRADPRPPGLMVGIPLTVLLVGVTAVAFAYLRRARVHAASHDDDGLTRIRVERS